jgi:hypothetical protein
MDITRRKPSDRQFGFRLCGWRDGRGREWNRQDAKDAKGGREWNRQDAKDAKGEGTTRMGAVAFSDGL